MKSAVAGKMLTPINRLVDEVRVEQQRLTLLAELGVLDTTPEPGFDALTQAAAALTNCPIALLSLVDGERQWFKSHLGIDRTQTPRRGSFCTHAIREPGLMQVHDATVDPRFADNPLVTGEPGIRFYAGETLAVDGIRIGTLCVIDTQPRELSSQAQQALKGLGAAASAMLAERRGRVVSSEEQRRLAEFAMVSGDWLWETDAAHRVVWMSCAYATDSGLREPWILGTPMANGPVLDELHEVATRQVSLHQLLDERREFARTVVRCEIAGETHYLSHSAVCRRDVAGHWCGYRGIARDITARVNAEQARRSAAALLAELSAQVPGLIFQSRLDPNGHVSFPYVSERIRDVFELSPAEVTTDVTEQVSEARQLQALGQAKVAAEKAVEVRSEFMSRVSHELRTPLNAILGFAQLLRMNGASQPGEETVRSAIQIENAGSHLLSLVNDMLDLSSLNAGRLNLRLRPVSIEPLVRRCLTLIEAHALQHGITLQVQADPALPTVLADGRAVMQIIFNLVGNAIKFGGRHSVVQVRVQHEPIAAQVRLEVSDQGHGIEADKLSALFEPFSRINRSGHAPVGSGLGLSISQKLVAAMAGSIAVRSEVGQGATFTVRLPVDGAAESTLPDDSGLGGFDDLVRLGPVGGATVLYIEDAPVNALLMQEFFKTLPATAPHLVVAATGREGLREAALLRPDLILLDMNLPDFDGLGVLRRLRADSRTAHIPVIAVSADALPEQVRRARDAGFDDYWTKPIELRHVHADLVRRFPPHA